MLHCLKKPKSPAFSGAARRAAAAAPPGHVRTVSTARPRAPANRPPHIWPGGLGCGYFTYHLGTQQSSDPERIDIIRARRRLASLSFESWTVLALQTWPAGPADHGAVPGQSRSGNAHDPSMQIAPPTALPARGRWKRQIEARSSQQPAVSRGGLATSSFPFSARLPT